MLRLILALALAATTAATASAQQGTPEVPPGYQQPPPQQQPPAPPPQQQAYPQQPGYYPQQPGYYPQQPQPEAEPEPRPASTVTFNPLALLIGFINFEYEFAAADFMTFYAGPQLWLFAPVVLGLDEDVDILAVGVTTGVRFFFSGRAPEGFWLGPQFAISYVEVSDASSEESAVGYGAAGMFGYTWIWGAFVLSVGGGYGYTRAEAGGAGYEGLQPFLRASIGVAF